MRIVRISDEVWEAIAASGRFGETEDDVLRRVFGLRPAGADVARNGRKGRGKRRFAEKRMSPRVQDQQFIVEFEDGIRNQWPLPAKTDKRGIRSLRDAAVKWALDHGGSDPGQTNAVRKALTNAEYFVSR